MLITYLGHLFEKSLVVITRLKKENKYAGICKSNLH